MPTRKTINISNKSRFIAAFLFAISITMDSLAQSIEYDGKEFKIELSDDVQAAIDNGVSITFENQLVHSKKWLLINWHSHQVTHTFLVSRHTLSNRYLVHNDSHIMPNIFRSTREAMTYICETAIEQFNNYHTKSNLTKPNSHALTPHKMRLRLNRTKLPGPMRLTAYINSTWNIDSGWKEWQSDQ